jgi:nitrate reductase NapE component
MEQQCINIWFHTIAVMGMQKFGNGNRRDGTYERFDNFMMRRVNEAVKVWNWTTGRTKADLANMFVMASVAIPIVNVAVSGGYSLLAAEVPFGLGAPFRIMTNKIIERLEKDAIESGLMNPTVEAYKIECRFNGALWSFAYPLATSTIALHDRYMEGNMTVYETFTASALMVGASKYVMRADYMPPRKNAFARGFEKLKDMVRTGAMQPVPIPVASTCSAIGNLTRH